MSASLEEFRRNTPLFGLSVLALLVGLSAPAAWSQATSTATLAGQVTDEQNAAIEGAEVRMVDPSTGASQTTMSNDQGRYVFVSVNPGTYMISVTKQGFAVFKIAAQKVD